uniref:HAUS augmin-like complex subunit 4 n=1 Tax=Pristiophorus japonicus TaxID=55135 RepID=UPI00398E7092
MEAEQLSRAVNLRLPDLNLGAEKLSQNPKFAKLLLHLADRVDLTGLSLSVKGQQEKAGGQLRNQKRDWLRSEALERVLQEMVTEHHVTRWESPASREDRQFFQTLEQSQVVAVSCRWLDTREEKEEKEEEEAQSCPPLLGLERNHLLDLLPDAR